MVLAQHPVALHGEILVSLQVFNTDEISLETFIPQGNSRMVSGEPWSPVAEAAALGTLGLLWLELWAFKVLGEKQTGLPSS